jgi:hypothetical protein
MVTYKQKNYQIEPRDPIIRFGDTRVPLFILKKDLLSSLQWYLVSFYCSMEALRASRRLVSAHGITS